MTSKRLTDTYDEAATAVTEKLIRIATTAKSMMDANLRTRSKINAEATFITIFDKFGTELPVYARWDYGREAWTVAGTWEGRPEDQVDIDPRVVGLAFTKHIDSLRERYRQTQKDATQ